MSRARATIRVTLDVPVSVDVAAGEGDTLRALSTTLQEIIRGEIARNRMTRNFGTTTQLVDRPTRVSACHYVGRIPRFPASR